MMMETGGGGGGGGAHHHDDGGGGGHHRHDQDGDDTSTDSSTSTCKHDDQHHHSMDDGDAHDDAAAAGADAANGCYNGGGEGASPGGDDDDGGEGEGDADVDAPFAPFVVDSSPERSPFPPQPASFDNRRVGGSPNTFPFRTAGTTMPPPAVIRTVQAPALVLLTSSSSSQQRDKNGAGENEDGNNDGNGDEGGEALKPVKFDRPVYKLRPSSTTSSSPPAAISSSATSTGQVAYDRQDDLPILPLWCDDGPSNPTSTDCYVHLYCGRLDLLMPYYYGCGCLSRNKGSMGKGDTSDMGKMDEQKQDDDSKGGGKGNAKDGGKKSGTILKRKRNPKKRRRKSDPLPLCDKCRQVEKWGTTYLSRQMIRLTPVDNNSGADGDDHGDDGDGEVDSEGGGSAVDGKKSAATAAAMSTTSTRPTRFVVAVKGPNAHLVRVDGIPVYDEDSQLLRHGGGGGGGNEEWVGNADLYVGSTLSIECPPAKKGGDGDDDDDNGSDDDDGVSAGMDIRRIAYRMMNVDVDIETLPVDRDRLVKFDDAGIGGAFGNADIDDDAGGDDKDNNDGGEAVFGEKEGKDMVPASSGEKGSAAAATTTTTSTGMAGVDSETTDGETDDDAALVLPTAALSSPSLKKPASIKDTSSGDNGANMPEPMEKKALTRSKDAEKIEPPVSAITNGDDAPLASPVEGKGSKFTPNADVEKMDEVHQELSGLDDASDGSKETDEDGEDDMDKTEAPDSVSSKVGPSEALSDSDEEGRKSRVKEAAADADVDDKVEYDEKEVNVVDPTEEEYNEDEATPMDGVAKSSEGMNIDSDTDDDDEAALKMPSTGPSDAKATKMKQDDHDAIDLTSPDASSKDFPKQQGPKDDGDIEVVELDDSPNDDVMVVGSAAVASSSSSAPRPRKVFFLELGKGMPHHRVQKLASNLTTKDRTVMIADSFRASQVTHIVIDDTVSATQVALSLGFQDEQSMAKVVARRKIFVVKPSWIIHARNVSDEPALDQLWSGLHGSATATSQQQKRPFEDMLTYQPTQDDSSDSANESVAEESDEDFGAVKKVKVSSLDDDNMASRMLKKRKVKAENKCRNVGLFNMFLEISKLHADCPMIELDNFKSKLYAKLAWRMRYLDYDIDYSTLDRLSEVDGFGPSVMGKVREYLMSGSCAKIDEFKTDPMRVAIKKLKDIWGVGKKKAHDLASEGYRNINDVRQGLATGRLELSKNALLGVKYYEELLEKMERSEVDRITEVVAEVCREIPRLAGVEIINQGSYRRGDSTCGDADLLIVHPDYVDHLPKGGLGEIVNKLEDKGYIAHHLNTVEGMTSATKKQAIIDKKRDQSNFDGDDSHKEEDSAYSYMSIFHSPVHKGKHRRVDLKLYPYQDRAYASLYFTGNTAFNRSMRSYAMQRKNYGLSDHGLYPLQDADKVRSHQQRRQYRSGRVHSSTEEEIFEKLGLVWRGPTERKCFDDVIEK